MSFGIMSHSGLCHIQDYVTFGIMSFGIMLHLGLCRIRTYVVRVNVVSVYVIWHNVVRHNVGVSPFPVLLMTHSEVRH